MNKPKFEVGEQVILVSVNYPQYNGLVHVYQVITQPTEYVCRTTQQLCLATCKGNSDLRPTTTYRLDPVMVDEEGMELLFAENVLRKIDPPSEMSFDQLMYDLKQPNEVYA